MNELSFSRRKNVGHSERGRGFYSARDVYWLATKCGLNKLAQVLTMQTF